MSSETLPGSRAADARSRLWLGAAVALSVLYAAIVLVLPAHGLTFLWDDWDQLASLHAQGARFVLEPYDVQWNPVFRAFLALEHAAFGSHHGAYLAVSLALHAGNLALLGRVLAARSGDVRAAALATAAFGCATSYRILLWWVMGQSILLAFGFTGLAFVALEEWRDRPRPWLLVGACLALAAAPLCHATGVAAGLSLALDAWVLRVPERRRFAGSVLAAWLATAALAAFFVSHSSHGASLAHLATLDSHRLAKSLAFALEFVGLGFTRQVLLLPVSTGPIAGFALAFVYLLAVALLAYLVGDAARRRLLLAHAYLAFLVGPMSLARASYVWSDRPNAAGEQYQYVPGFVWSLALALGAAELLRRRPRVALVGGLLLLGVLASRHEEAARWDRNYFAPEVRRNLREAEIVARLATVAATSTGALYDAGLPHWLAWPSRRAHDLVAVVAPEVSARWTDVATPESVAPLARDPLLFAVLDLGGR